VAHDTSPLAGALSVGPIKTETLYYVIIFDNTLILILILPFRYVEKE